MAKEENGRSENWLATHKWAFGTGLLLALADIALTILLSLTIISPPEGLSTEAAIALAWVVGIIAWIIFQAIRVAYYMQEISDGVRAIRKELKSKNLEQITRLWKRWPDQLKPERNRKHIPVKIGRDCIANIAQNGLGELNKKVSEIFQHTQFVLIEKYTKTSIEMTSTIPRPRWFLEEFIEEMKTRGTVKRTYRALTSLERLKRLELVAKMRERVFPDKKIHMWRVFSLRPENILWILMEAICNLRTSTYPDRISYTGEDIPEIAWFKNYICRMSDITKNYPDKFRIFWTLDKLVCDNDEGIFANIKIDSNIEDYVLFNRDLVVKFYLMAEQQRGAFSFIWDELWNQEGFVSKYSSPFKYIEQNISDSKKLEEQYLFTDFAKLLENLHDLELKWYPKETRLVISSQDVKSPVDNDYYPFELTKFKKPRGRPSHQSRLDDLKEALGILIRRLGSLENIGVCDLYLEIRKVLTQGDLFFDGEYVRLFELDPCNWRKQLP